MYQGYDAVLAERPGRAGFRPNTLDVTVTHTELFRRHERREGENLIVDLTVFNRCAPTNLEKEAERPRSVITATVKRKSISIWVHPWYLHPTFASRVDVRNVVLGYVSSDQGYGGQARRPPG